MYLASIKSSIVAKSGISGHISFKLKTFVLLNTPPIFIILFLFAIPELSESRIVKTLLTLLMLMYDAT